jgi:uncharacterized protein (DUF58 family)
MNMRHNLSDDVLRTIRQLEIHTKRLLAGQMVGDARSAQKGSGFDFDQIREYQPGDDVRFIDWSATARSGKMLFKQYREDRSRTLILAVDVSGSSFFASARGEKYDLIAQMATVLALVSEYGKDKVSLILFSDEVELFIPPACSHLHTRWIIETLFSYKPRSTKTNIECVYERLAKLQRNDAMVFVISDFINAESQRFLATVAARYDVVAIRCRDDFERALPALGFITTQDMETGQMITLDLRKRSVARVQKHIEMQTSEQNNLFRRYAIDVLDMQVGRPFMGELVTFFRRRMQY